MHSTSVTMASGTCDGKYCPEGSAIDFYIDEHSVSDAKFVCENGAWDARALN